MDDRSVMNLKSSDRLKQEVKTKTIIDFIRFSCTVEFFDKYEENEDATNLFNDLHEYYANWDSGIGDACRICNWGMTNRDDYPEMVLLDTGLSMEVYRKHYA